MADRGTDTIARTVGVSHDPTAGLEERELWAFASRLLAQHRECVGDVAFALFKEHSLGPDRGAMRRWMQVMDMIEQLNGPRDDGAIQ